MKTIHEQLSEMLGLMELLKDSGIEVTILCKAQEIEPVPKEFTESLAKGFLPRILKFYENEENMQEYMEWKSKQEEAEKATA